MPPRYAYWTILIDDKPTAFRAREREELQPTFAQLQRKNANVVMRWFARGKLWASREAEREDFQMQKQAASAPRDRHAARPAESERRGSDWRPGGAHKDPRDRFKKKNRPERAWSEKDPATQRDRDKPGYKSARPPAPRDDRPRQDEQRVNQPRGGRPSGEGGWRDRRPWENKPAPHNDRPWQTKPTGPRAQRAPWVGKPQGDRSWSGKPSGAPPRGDRPWRDKPAGAPRGDRPSGDRRPWEGKPRADKPGGFQGSGAHRERKPWNAKPGGPPSGNRPWSAKPPSAGDRKPWQKRPFRPSGPPRPDARKRRDDDPPDQD